LPTASRPAVQYCNTKPARRRARRQIRSISKRPVQSNTLELTHSNQAAPRAAYGADTARQLDSGTGGGSPDKTDEALSVRRNSLHLHTFINFMGRQVIEFELSLLLALNLLYKR
jgi:hypothetical protein